MVRLTIDIPEAAFSELREAPERFGAEMRSAAAVQWYHEGRIGGSKAAQIDGMSRLELLDELARRRLDVVRGGPGSAAARTSRWLSRPWSMPHR